MAGKQALVWTILNFLAHTLFAQGDAERIAGQFCGDFIRGADLSGYSEGIQQGIRRHRRIDAYTDRHPAVKATHGVFKPPVRRFAGIVTDVVFDHYLAIHWDNYSDVPLQQHVATVHEALNEMHDQLPVELQRFSRFLQRENLLLGNLHFSGVEITLERLSKRSPKFAPLAQGATIAKQNEPVLLDAFNQFFPELVGIERKKPM